MFGLKKRGATTLALTAVVGLGTWALAGLLQARVTELRQDRQEQGVPMLEFQRLHERGAVLVVDVRDRSSYEAGRISGAVHATSEQLQSDPASLSGIRRLARGRLVVTYCSCPTEASSLRAARILADGGVAARALVGGYPKWVDAGGQVERGGPIP
jgi:rhodanese-related sulfurtransferase